MRKISTLDFRHLCPSILSSAAKQETKSSSFVNSDNFYHLLSQDPWIKRTHGEDEPDLTSNIQPIAPKPHFLHLTLGLEVVNHEELQHNWPESWKTQFIDRYAISEQILMDFYLILLHKMWKPVIPFCEASTGNCVFHVLFCLHE